MANKKKEIKIVRESETNYTFLDGGLTDIKRESEDDRVNNTSTITEKDIIKARSLNSKKLRIRHKSRISGGQVQQAHSSVYE